MSEARKPFESAYERFELDSFDVESAPIQRESNSATTITLQQSAEIERIKEQARVTGFNEGQSQGYAEGLERAKSETAALKEQTIALGTQIQQWMCDVEEQATREILQLALVLAKAMTLQQFNYDSEPLVTAIRTSVRQLPAQKELAIQVHPDDEDVVSKTFAQQISERAWSVSSDEALSRGSFTIDTSSNYIDGRVETRWEHLTSQLFADSVILRPQTQ